MASYDDSKRKHGRQYDQLTKDGTGSAASVGPGGTGDLDRSLQQGNQQPGGRTDDLLSGDSDEDAKGFRNPGELQTGMGGSGSLSQGKQSAQGGAGGSMQGDPAENEVPPGDARISHKSDRGT